MIKILLVDDDFLVRTFLSRLTNWNAHGYSVVGAAQDGEQALEMTQEYQPDIIITDISMPVMDGITLIRRLKKENNPAKIVVLSCHDDFEYVREAMKLGADEYVLKNLLTEQSMLKLLGELEKDMVQPLGKYDPEQERAEIVQQLKGERQPDEQSAFRIRAVLAVRVKDYDKRVTILPMEQQERFRASFLQVCQDSARHNNLIRSVHVRRELYAVVFDFRKGESRAERQEALSQAATTLAHNTDRYLAAEVRIGVSDTPDFSMQPSACWESALDALEATFYEPQAICYAWQCPAISQCHSGRSTRLLREYCGVYGAARRQCHSGILCTGAGSICIAAHTIAFGAGMDDAGAAQCRTFGTGSTAAFFRAGRTRAGILGIL